MSDAEITSFLTSNNTGVLSLAGENRGYGFPISFTYDQEHNRLILGFVASPGSEKRELVTATETATFTVYADKDVDSWRSIMVTGGIRPITDGDGTLQVPDLFFYSDADDVEDDRMVSLDEFERTYYELDIETLSGRHSGKGSSRS